jgi:carboxymethylenebutenolidase
MSQQQALTAEQQKLSNLWDAHVSAEFDALSADEAIATMVANPRVWLALLMAGGEGKEEVYEFYSKHFISEIPPDSEMIRVSRTVGSREALRRRRGIRLEKNEAREKLDG